MELRASPHAAIRGEVSIPGDKSISHRALMFAALAVGESRVRGLLEGEDVLSTANALRDLGVTISSDNDGEWTVHGVGVGGFREPADVLDMGNAGTGARLLTGLLAGNALTAFMTGDASLRSRPMKRVIEPLTKMGARIVPREGLRLPMAIVGSPSLSPIVWRSGVASAQVKSAILLAGLHAPGVTTVVEPQASRDHTERMLAGMGAVVHVEDDAAGQHVVSISGQPELKPFALDVPGDPSSAAFVIAAALLRPHSCVRVRSLMLNPLRSGFLATVQEMGAHVEIENRRQAGGEEIGDLVVRSASLRGVEVPASRAPSMIDEYPILAVLASFAEGPTVMRGLSELRVKESDRLATMADGLQAVGVRADVEGDDLTVVPGHPPRGGCSIASKLDHRIAMSFLVMGGGAQEPITVVDAESIETSFPGFAPLLNGLGAEITEAP